jgi:hypothetical protein
MKEIFPIEPGSAGPIWVFLVLLILFIVLTGLFAYFIYSSRNSVIELDERGIAIRNSLYGRVIPWSSIRKEGVKVVDLQSSADLKLTGRRNGVGLPGYYAGWFRLRGGSKALAFVTNRRSVVYIPTSEDYVLLFSAKDADRLVGSIRRFEL